MDIAVDRRSFLIAGSFTITALAAGSAYYWWESADASPRPVDDAIRVVPGTDRPLSVAPPPAAAPPVLADASVTPDGDTEARLSRLIEDDVANSRQRMRERQQRRSEAPPAIPTFSGDATSTTWAP